MLGAVPGLGTKRVTALLAEKSIAEIAAMDSSAISALVIGGKKIGEKLATTIAGALCAKAPV
jgi:predicted alpha/beta-hydrolase family hydrolase